MTLSTALLIFAVGGLGSWALDYAVQPRPKRGRSWRSAAIHAGVWCMGCALELVLFQRPWFGIANLLGLQLLLIIISNMKQRYLAEPFFYTDTEYFLDALKHPRLYIPFFGVWNAVGGFVAYGVAVWLAYRFEAAYTGWWALALGLVGLGWVLLRSAGPVQQAALCFKPNTDIAQLGFVPALWRYAQAEQHRPRIPQSARPFAQSWQAPACLPHLIMVQAESFFDPRRYYADYVRPDVFSQFDALAAHGQKGVVQVPSWGANTVRTEYAVLSGVDPMHLGVHQFNPYRRLALHQVESVGRYLQSLGYYTLCVHPYAASFYRRHRAIPRLGFDEFVDGTAFKHAPKFGAYVADQAVGQWVADYMQQLDPAKPVFVYVITMENHGPLHWEQVSAAEQQQLLLQPLPTGCADLAAYLRHSQHTDLMLQQISSSLLHSPRPAGLCVFGDHVPIMSTVYQQLDRPDKATDYLMWHSQCAPTQQPAHYQPPLSLAAHELSPAFLRFMGFEVGQENKAKS